LPGRDQSSRRGGGALPSPTFTSTAQLVRRLAGLDPSAIGYTTTLACSPPATIIERPLKNTGQSRAPRHSISPFQHGGPSSGNRVSRTRE
jgi:hypothetical protein